MKRLLVLLLLVISCFCLCSCEEFVTSEEQLPANVQSYLGGRFGLVKDISSFSMIVFDKETGVQYFCVKNDKEFELTVLLDKDGKPLLYKKFIYGDKK